MNPHWLNQYPHLASDISEILLTPEDIQGRIHQLGSEISKDYAAKNPILIGVLKGVLIFMADLIRAINIPIEVDFMAVTSYSSEARDKGLVRLVKDLETSITGRHVLFVEDVVDTGLTLNYLLSTLKMRQPMSLEVCTLFDKKKMRLVDLPIKYIGFDLPDRFVVGYGLDHREKYRNLPFVGLLKTQALVNKNRGPE